MSVEFDEERNAPRTFTDNSSGSKFAAWLIAHGVAKDESGANKIMVIAAIVMLVLAAYLVLR